MFFSGLCRRFETFMGNGDSFAAALPPATDRQPLTRLIHGFIVSSSFIAGNRWCEGGCCCLSVCYGRVCARDCSGNGRQGRWLESPLAPLKGGDQRVTWPVSAGHWSVKPDGAAAQDGMTYAIVGTMCTSSLQNGHNGPPPRRGAQIKKLMIVNYTRIELVKRE